MMYAKICTHLRCFGSRFTLKFDQARIRARSNVHNFHAVIFRPHSLLQNRSIIYVIRIHLRYFGSRFMIKSTRARTLARSVTRDFHAVILGPVCCYKTEIGFTLNFVLIYAVLAHGLRWNPPEPEPEPHTA
jgi:hypothetical protein